MDQNKVLPFGLGESSYLALMSFLIFLPYVGWIAPIIMWAMGKDISESVNRQGKYILNWYISWFIYSFILGIFLVVCLLSGIGSMAAISNIESISPTQIIGLATGSAGIVFLILAVVAILSIAFPIIGGVKGLNNQTWKYPLSIPFLK